MKHENLTNPIYYNAPYEFIIPLQYDKSNIGVLNISDFKQSPNPIKFNYLENMQEKILQFKNLKNNWDGFNADPPDNVTIRNSYEIVEKIPEIILKEIDNNNILSTPYGTIIIDIKKNNETISIEIGKTKIGFYIKLNENENIVEEGQIINKNKLPDEIEFALNKMFF